LPEHPNSNAASGSLYAVLLVLLDDRNPTINLAMVLAITGLGFSKFGAVKVNFHPDVTS
jgi:hypothetical protein